MTSDLEQVLADRVAGKVVDLGPVVDNTIHAADDLNDALDLGLPQLDGDWEQAASLLARVVHARKLLHQLEAVLELFIAEHGPYGDTEVEGLGVVKVHRSNSRREWRHDDWQRDVRSAVLAASDLGETLVDPSTGLAVSAHDLLAAVQRVHGAGAPKVTALKALGLDAGDYAVKIPGRLGVVVDTATGADAPQGD